MAAYQQYGHMRGYMSGDNGFQFSQTTAALGPTKQAAFSFRKRFERIDWKRLGKFCVPVCLCLCVCLFVSVFACVSVCLCVCVCLSMSVFACGVCMSELYTLVML